jgi:hypothetical protein
VCVKRELNTHTHTHKRKIGGQVDRDKLTVVRYGW